jgi:hypothetical protein
LVRGLAEPTEHDSAYLWQVLINNSHESPQQQHVHSYAFTYSKQQRSTASKTIQLPLYKQDFSDAIHHCKHHTVSVSKASTYIRLQGWMCHLTMQGI